MRWSLGRLGAGTRGGAAVAAAHPAAEPVPAAPPRPPAPPPARPWQGVAPLRPRSMTLHPVARSTDFTRTLRTRQASPVTLRPAEHAVAPARSGRVHGTAARVEAPVPAATSGPPSPRGLARLTGGRPDRRSRTADRSPHVTPEPTGGTGAGPAREGASRAVTSTSRGTDGSPRAGDHPVGGRPAHPRVPPDVPSARAVDRSAPFAGPTTASPRTTPPPGRAVLRSGGRIEPGPDRTAQPGDGAAPRGELRPATPELAGRAAHRVVDASPGARPTAGSAAGPGAGPGAGSGGAPAAAPGAGTGAARDGVGVRSVGRSAVAHPRGTARPVGPAGPGAPESTPPAPAGGSTLAVGGRTPVAPGAPGAPDATGALGTPGPAPGRGVPPARRIGVGRPTARATPGAGASAVPATDVAGPAVTSHAGEPDVSRAPRHTGAGLPHGQRGETAGTGPGRRAPAAVPPGALPGGAAPASAPPAERTSAGPTTPVRRSGLGPGSSTAARVPGAGAPAERGGAPATAPDGVPVRPLGIGPGVARTPAPPRSGATGGGENRATFRSVAVRPGTPASRSATTTPSTGPTAPVGSTVPASSRVPPAPPGPVVPAPPTTPAGSAARLASTGHRTGPGPASDGPAPGDGVARPPGPRPAASPSGDLPPGPATTGAARLVPDVRTVGRSTGGRDGRLTAPGGTVARVPVRRTPAEVRRTAPPPAPPADPGGLGRHPGGPTSPAPVPVATRGTPGTTPTAPARAVRTGTPGVRTAAADDDPGEVAVAVGLANRVSPTEVRFVPAGGDTVRRAPEDGAATAEPAPAVGASAAAAGVGVGVGVGEIVAVAPAPAAAPDLAALADELYERLENRLRLDLLLERERRGMLPDA